MYAVVVGTTIIETYPAGKCNMAMLVAQMFGGRVVRIVK